ncbi:MAG: VOC family protein [Solirubrobacteraceae bacterium]
MAERDSHPPGTFSWADLSTTDPEAAKAFYGGLFGWVAEDMPVGDGAVYSMMRKDGRDAAAIAPQPSQQREAGVPPMRNSYVTVESADATAERATELGGAVHAPPFDVMEAGRMAVLQDPQGAFFVAWDPRSNIGGVWSTHRVRCPGTSSPPPTSTPPRSSTVASSAGRPRRWREAPSPTW